MGPISPYHILRLMVHEADDFPTFRALCLASKALSILATPRMLRLTINDDTRRIQDPGSLVHSGPTLFEKTNTVTGHDQPGTETHSGKESGLCIADRIAISNYPSRCEQEIRDAAAPMVLWAALQPPRLATKLLSRVLNLKPRHIWSFFTRPQHRL
ncbi:hypothetical protein CSUB01_11386 [Colletotrichum sublineola]|uniref:Uncharacterized protein n=1 Tax=Colletotrichum sublineola TaxID=1173701 RepID=A0A066XCC9_COLSU|nr:hypothetical protein CSUB01_11386 [Colletotrichum sublineola]